MNDQNFWVSEAWGGFGNTYQIKETLFEKVTKYQKIQIFDTVKLGRMLMLDNITQLTYFDEFAYHEMMAHPALFAHPNPERILVIGGGDGGTLREAAKHKSLQQLHLCDIDAEVVAACREFLPQTACGFDDPRVEIFIADGCEFIKQKKAFYDVIIIDSTDPGGPGAPLFGAEFYRDVAAALRPGGVVAAQSESPYLLPEVVKSLRDISQSIFKFCNYGLIYIPTYPTGCIGFGLYSLDRDPASLARPMDSELADSLRYYDAKIHQTSLETPLFVKKLLNS